jgi:putative redox protein
MAISAIQARTGEFSYRIEFTARDHQWFADEPSDQGGANSAPTPSELLLSSLAACTAITLQMYAARKHWPLTGVALSLSLNPDGKPAAGTDIRRQLQLKGDLDDAQRERLLQIANACPVHRLLTGEVRIETALVEQEDNL